MQVVTKMLDELGTRVLREPNQIIAFVDYSLAESESKLASERGTERRGKTSSASTLRMEDLKIVDEDEDEDEDEEGVSENEDGETSGLGAREEMAMTGLTLLLAVLEGDFPL
jgi:hypothetical protein